MPRFARVPAARFLLDVGSLACLGVLWATDGTTVWLHAAFVVVALRAFVQNGGLATAVRTTVVGIAGGALLLHFHSTGSVSTSDILQVPLLALLLYLFAAFAELRAREGQGVARDRSQLERLVDQFPLATVVVGSGARVLTWNKAAETLFGWRAHEVIGEQTPVVTSGERAGSDAIYARARAGERLAAVDVTRHTRDGRPLELSLYTAPLGSGDDASLLVMYEDIGERRHAERERDEAQRRYRGLIESLPGVTYIDRINPNSNVETNIYMSPQITELLGWDPDDWVETEQAYESILHPDDAPHVIAEVRRSNANQTAFDLEYRMRHRDGGYVWVHDQRAVVEEVGGERLARGFVVDLTQRKRLEEQLLQAQKMDAIGQFAGGIAHDFNNLLMAISGYADLAAALNRSDGQLMQFLDRIRSATGEAASLTSQLLSFSRHDVGERHLVNLNTVARSTAELLERLLPDDVQTRLELAEPLAPVLGDAVQLKQVVLNLALNARDAMTAGGLLTIETVGDGKNIVLNVRDDGCGMDEQTRLRAFEPFYTTKPEGKGTGLGLSVVFGVIESLGGTVAIVSAPDEGTTVRVELPAVADATADEANVTDTPVLAAGTGRILLVEDREIVRSLITEVLRTAGFDVGVAAHGHDALTLAGEGEPFDLLLTDVVMPDLSGPQLAQHLRSVQPSLRVLYMSGYTDDVLDEAELSRPGTAFIRKPFQDARLVAAVHEQLTG